MANTKFMKYAPIVAIVILAIFLFRGYISNSDLAENFECWCRQGTPAVPTAVIPTATGVVALPIPPTFTNQLLKNAYGARVLDCNGGSCNQGTKVQLWSKSGAAGQNWTYDPTKMTFTSGGQCLDVPNGGNADGLALQTWPCNGSTAQQWKWQANQGTAKGDYQIVNPNSGKCLDVAGGGVPGDKDGTATQLWNCPGSATAWTV